MSNSVADIVEAICSTNAQFAASCAAYREALRTWEAEGVLLPADLAGKHVLDWECGRGVFSALFVEHGAAEVTGIDSWLDTDYVQQQLRDLPARFQRVSLREFAADRRTAGAYDLIFANTVTEHMIDVAALLPVCYGLLAAGGILVLNHDNYYQPVGSHDHGFLFYQNGAIEFLGPRCWQERRKCAVSEDFRRGIAERLPWTWDDRTESRLDPRDCTQCPYFRRAQPWGHLLCQSQFRRVFAQPCFTTGYPGSSLNKITPFMLRQFLIEAGFDIERWVPHTVPNQPPVELLRPPFSFSADDLVTTTVSVRCVKGAAPSYSDLPPFPGAP